MRGIVRADPDLTRYERRVTMPVISISPERPTGLNVAFISHAGDAMGGAEISQLLLLADLPEDVRVSAILFQDGRFARRLREIGVQTSILPMSDAIMSTTRENAGMAGILRLPSAILRLASQLRSRRFDVVVTNSVKAHVIGAVASKLAGTPCVMHMRDILSGAAGIALTIIAHTLTRARITCSKAAALALRAMPITVLAEPLDLTLYDDLPSKERARNVLGLPQDRPIVAIIGRINRWKGHDRFLRIAKLVGETTRAHFVIVGSPVFRDADFVPELHELARTLGITERVSFIPWLDDPRTIYAAIDVHCNCSDAEPFGRTSTEAAAAAVPTVCFDEGGAAETIVNGVTGVAVSPQDEIAFARAIIEYLENPERLATASAAARENRVRYDARSARGIFFDILRRAAKKKDA